MAGALVLGSAANAFASTHLRWADVCIVENSHLRWAYQENPC